MFLKQIKKMNGKYLIKDNKVTIYPSKIKNNNIVCEDLRGGAALLLCCLAAKGTSVLSNIKYIERGYEDIVKNLRKIGASIDEIYINE
jgi:UDP-N-acetylglucosamine 1-carboxyvinyltransferase